MCFNEEEHVHVSLQVFIEASLAMRHVGTAEMDKRFPNPRSTILVFQPPSYMWAVSFLYQSRTTRSRGGKMSCFLSIRDSKVSIAVLIRSVFR